jgi:hypothetical protein
VLLDGFVVDIANAVNDAVLGLHQTSLAPSGDADTGSTADTSIWVASGEESEEEPDESDPQPDNNGIVDAVADKALRVPCSRCFSTTHWPAVLGSRLSLQRAGRTYSRLLSLS